MGRIRTIKPELPQSESLGRVSREARLCFVLLFTLADDAGRLRGNSRMLASLLYPYDIDASQLIDTWLKELQNQDCILRYHAQHKSYIEIRNWSEHQKIQHPSKPKMPAPESSGSLMNPHEDYREDQGRDQGEDQGSRSEEPHEVFHEAKGKRAKTARTAQAPTSPDRAHRLPDDFKVTDEHRNWAREENLPDPDSLIAEFCDHYRANGKTMTNWDASFRSWIRKEQKMYPKGRKVNGQYKTAREKSLAEHAEAIADIRAGRGPLQGRLPDS